MKKIIFALVIGISFLLLAAGCSCAQVHANSSSIKAQLRSQPPCKVVVNTYKMYNFSKLIIKGPFQVELVNGRPCVSLQGFASDLAKVNVRQDNGVLYLSFPRNNLPANFVRVRVSTYNLRSLAITGQARITAQNYRASHLQICASGRSSVMMSGSIGVDCIEQKNNSNIQLANVHGGELKIVSSRGGSVCLSGAVDNLLAQLSCNTELMAQCLQAQHATLVLTDNAEAHVWVIEDLNASADASSSVFYRQRPKEFNTNPYYFGKPFGGAFGDLFKLEL